jgi:hypothetical protein
MMSQPIRPQLKFSSPTLHLQTGDKYISDKADGNVSQRHDLELFKQSGKTEYLKLSRRK